MSSSSVDVSCTSTDIRVLRFSLLPSRFGIRIAGSFLSWGRGKTRDAAIDAAIRAAFALVAAHGYDDYTMTEDCFTEEPVDNFMGGMPPVSWHPKMCPVY